MNIWEMLNFTYVWRNECYNICDTAEPIRLEQLQEFLIMLLQRAALSRSGQSLNPFFLWFYSYVFTIS